MNPSVFLSALLNSTKNNPLSSVGGIMAAGGIFFGWIGFRLPVTDTEWFLTIGCLGLLLQGLSGQDADKVLGAVLDEAAVQIAESKVKPPVVIAPVVKKQEIKEVLAEMAPKVEPKTFEKD